MLNEIYFFHMQIDANNLYGFAQSCRMPIGNYKWMTTEDIEAKDWTQFNENANTGQILEVDLEYPQKYHLQHNSLVLAPHRMAINESHLSNFAKECLLQLRGTNHHSSEKLVSTFLPRKNYVVHAANLALYLELGMILTKVHRVLSFDQSNFLQEYIAFCTCKRAEAKSDFRKRLFKLFSNSNYGKFIENKRIHLQCKIVADKKSFEKWAANPRFSNFKVLNESGIVAMFLTQKQIVMRQAWAIGFTILERSKSLVYSDYYKRIKPALNNQCAVIFSDTDSLLLRINPEFSKDDVLDRLHNIMDFSNYPPNHPRYSTLRQNQLRFWKDEMKGSDVEEFVGLAAKTYSIRLNEEGVQRTQSKCKGVGKFFRKRIPFEEYKKCITSIDQHRVNQYSIQSKDHVIRTIKFDRLCFSSFDDKRYILSCGIHTVPYGSIFIPPQDDKDDCPFCKYYQ
jgi:hypothetical protein